MKRCAFSLLLTGCVVPLAFAQDREHIQLGVFASAWRRPTTTLAASVLSPAFKPLRN
jgi:hypothetical protein